MLEGMKLSSSLVQEVTKSDASPRDERPGWRMIRYVKPKYMNYTTYTYGKSDISRRCFTSVLVPQHCEGPQV